MKCNSGDKWCTIDQALCAINKLRDYANCNNHLTCADLN